MIYRVGNGFDIHALVASRPFILGGVNIPWHKGLKGHSDGDALIHALCDALLGAAALGDIGTHFPDYKAEYKNAQSSIFLQKVMTLLTAESWKLANVDCTIMLEEPKLVDYKADIVSSLCSLTGLAANQVSVKAKTAEGFGAIGKQEALAVWVSVLIYQNE